MAQTIRRTSLLLAIGVTALPAFPAEVLAATSHGDTQRVLVKDGTKAGRVRRGEDGKERPLKNYGTGIEQAQMAQLDTGDLLMFGMGSYEINGERPTNRFQLLCSHVAFNPMTGPAVTALKYVTANNGNNNRNANHPRVTPIFGGKAVAVTYNYAPNNHAQTYTQVFGANCEALSERQRIMAKNNDNCSEQKQSGVVVTQTATYARILAQDGCNGNGSDDSWVSMTRITADGNGRYTVSKEFDLVVENDEERTRGTVMLTPDPNVAMACWNAGNTQPANKGVRCGAIDIREETPAGGNSQRLLWRKYVEQREGQIYRNEIRSIPITDANGKATGKFMAMYQEANRRRRNGKGSQTAIAAILEQTPTGLAQVSPKLEGSMAMPGIDATHGESCGTMWGDDGVGTFKQFVMNGSFNGAPEALSTAFIVGFDATRNTMVTERKVGLRAAIDHSWLSNIYGENPNTQGRNFMHCQGNIKNPGFGVTGGYMSDVKSFVAIPATTRRRDAAGQMEDKLAWELLLVPAVINAQAQTGGMKKAPVSDNEEILNLAWTDRGWLKGLPKANAQIDAEKTAPRAPTGQTLDTESPAPAKQAGAAGCSTTRDTAAAPLALFGLGTVLVLSRRRRRA